MNNELGSHCRLCAQVFPPVQLFNTESDPDIATKINTLLWISTSATPSKNLPKLICFACHNLLVSTFNYLDDVRKVLENNTSSNAPTHTRSDTKSLEDAGKSKLPWVEVEVPLPEVKVERMSPTEEITVMDEFLVEAVFHESPELSNSTIPKEQKTCRLCGYEVADSESLDINTDPELAMKVKSVMSAVYVDNGSNTLSSKICRPCHTLNEGCLNFYQQIKQANQHLSKVYTNQLSEDSNTQESNPPIKEWVEFEVCNIKVENPSPTEMSNPNHYEVNVSIKQEALSDSSSEGGEEYNEQKKKPAIKKERKVRVYPPLPCKYEDFPEDPADPKGSWIDHIWMCGQCDMRLPDVQSLSQHSLQEHSSCCAFKCIDCAKVIDNFSKFVLHVCSHKEHLRLWCDYCNKHFAEVLHVKNHKLIHHRRQYQKYCVKCGITFNTTKQLNEHLDRDSELQRKKKPDTRVRRKKNPDKQKEALELQTQQNQQLAVMYKCDVCDKEFRQPGCLRKHRVTHTERPRDYICDHCGKGFYSIHYLRLHMTIHIQKTINCPYCPWSFKTQIALNMHLTTHSNLKPYKCDVCDKEFRIKRQLKSHYTIHTGAKPYNCKICGKAFRFSNSKQIHERMHTGHRPYVCVECSKQFSDWGNYNRHMKTHTEKTS